MDSFVLLVSASLSSCFGFLLLSYGRLFIEFLLSQVTDDTVAGALSLETTQCAFNVFVFTNSNRRHTCFHHPLPMRFLNYLNIIARKKGIVKPFFALFLYFSVENGSFYALSKSLAGCLHQGQMKSSGNSPSWT